MPPASTRPVDFSNPLSPPREASLWLQPFPEDLFAPTSSIPEARYDAYEGISLAFLVALHVLPPRQRTVLILKDVLDWSMTEIADTLETTQLSVTSLLHRAQATMKQRNLVGRRDIHRVSRLDNMTRKLLERYMRAWESADVEGILALLIEEATFPMPPFPVWVQGKPIIKTFIKGAILSGEAQNRWKLIPIRANGQPGYAFYRFDEPARTYHPFALQVLTIADGLISAATTFGFPAIFRFFNLPPVLTI